MTSGNGYGQETVWLTDFCAYMPQHTYIFKPTGEMWTAAGVNARLGMIVPPAGDPMKANAVIDKSSPVEQMTWMPGEPQLITGKLVMEGGWVAKPGATVFNLYRPPTIIRRTGATARWTSHVQNVYGDDAEHIVNWCAHRVQHPGQKVNHGLVLGGEPGIGKDTMLEPVKNAIGEWNFKEVSPASMLERFNPYLRSVILRISEAHDRGELNRYAFYEHTKILLAAPPNMLRIDEKNIREYLIPNICGIIMTTNRKDALYLPANDRRHFVAWSDKTQADFDQDYWNSLYHWYEHGGYETVAGYLANRDISEWDPKAPPPKTTAFWEIVANSSSPENVEIAGLIERMGSPHALTVDQLRLMADPSLVQWLDDRKNRKTIPHRLDDCGYVKVHNPDNKQGLWRVNGIQAVAYARAELSLSQRYSAVSAIR